MLEPVVGAVGAPGGLVVVLPALPVSGTVEAGLAVLVPEETVSRVDGVEVADTAVVSVVGIGIGIGVVVADMTLEVTSVAVVVS